MRIPIRFFPAALFIAACTTGGGGGTEYVSVALAATRLVGTYTLVDYLFEYGDGNKYDPSILKLTGKLYVRADSTYLEDIVIEGKATPTGGNILKVAAEDGNVEKGNLTLDLEAGDSSAIGISRYAFNGDTLKLSTEVSKERDASRLGFKETKWYARDP